MNVGRRLAGIFGEDEPPADPGLIIDTTGERIIPHPDDAVAEPELPREVGERIRRLIRAGDLEAAAELSQKALDNVGIGH